MREIFKLLQYLCYCLINFDEIAHGKAYSPFQADEWAKVWEFFSPSWQTAANSKIEKNVYILLFFTQKQRKSVNNCFHAKRVKYSNFYDIFAAIWPIWMKFCMMTHISYPEHNSCSKSQI